MPMNDDWTFYKMNLPFLLFIYLSLHTKLKIKLDLDFDQPKRFLRAKV